jgi:hypothetical protein
MISILLPIQPRPHPAPAKGIVEIVVAAQSAVEFLRRGVTVKV